MDKFDCDYEYWSLHCKLRDYVNTAPRNTLKLKESLWNKLQWIKLSLNLYENKDFLHNGLLSDLKRGDVILVELGENIGKEFSGQHPAVVLRDCPQEIEQVFILPLTSKKPKSYNPSIKGIYMEFKKIPGMKGYQHATNRFHKDNGKHWCNILNVRNISKHRICFPPTPCCMDGKDLDRISKTIRKQIAL